MFWACDVTGCGTSAVRIHGDCILCQRHLCSEHLQAPSHGCPKWKVYQPLDINE